MLQRPAAGFTSLSVLIPLVQLGTGKIGSSGASRNVARSSYAALNTTDANVGTEGMNRRTVARSRELASLLVVCVLLAAGLAPAGLASVSPTVRASTAAAASPLPDVSVVAAVATPGPQTSHAAVSGPEATPRPFEPPTGSSDPTEPADPTASEPPPATASLGCSDIPAGTRPAAVVSHGSRSKKVVALTFDDGYGPVNTIKILELLERNHVNATFFPTGRALQLYPEVFRQIVSAGFPIGDHTFDHHDMAGLCFATQVRELTRQQAMAQEVLGITPMPIMRPPFGSRDALTPYAAQAAGDVRVILWDVDTRDWSGISAWRVYKRAIVGGNGSIVLMHTFPEATADALTRIIASYRQRGFEFVTIGQLLGIPGPVPFG
jgi:peptidoglycan/xylan/chitin deacetylase (PgdA/CDA1 family)